jgi:hypothetical protein
MATTIYLRASQTQPRAYPQNAYRDILQTNPIDTLTAMVTDTTTPTERPFGPTAGLEGAFWSERISILVTVSGNITFSIRAVADAGFTGRLRVKLYKISAGGTNLETFIGQADAAGNIPTAVAAQSITIVPSAPFGMERGERFIVRLFAGDVAGSFGTGKATINYNQGSTLAATVVFVETVTFQANSSKMYCRDSMLTGIGVFRDLLNAIGSGPKVTAVVATQAGASEIQYTRAIAVTGINVAAAPIASTTNAATYASPSFTPKVNTLYLLAVSHSDAAPEATVPTISTTTGLAFVQVATVVFNTIANNLQRLTLFRAMKSSGLSAGTFTVNLADAGTGCLAQLAEVAMVLGTGTDGADAIRNVSTNNANATANPNVTLGAFNDVKNATYACFGTNLATAPTAGAGFTTLLANTYSTPTAGLYSEFQAANDTTATCTLASSDWAGIAVELVADPAQLGVLEWITPRFKSPGWSLDTLDILGDFATDPGKAPYCYASQSNAAANCTVQMKLFRYRPDGTELLVATYTITAAELDTVESARPYTSVNGPRTLHQPTTFYEDDRLISRSYIVPFPALTMGGGFTCTLPYNGPSPQIAGEVSITILDGPEFKAEGDPFGQGRVPDGQPMMGISN